MLGTLLDLRTLPVASGGGGKNSGKSASPSLHRHLELLVLFIDPQLPPKLLLYPQNRVLRRLGDSEFDDCFGWNLDFLLRLRIEAHASLSFLLYQLAEAGYHELAFLLNLFVSESLDATVRVLSAKIGKHGSATHHLANVLRAMSLAFNGSLSHWPEVVEYAGKLAAALRDEDLNI